MIYRIVHALLLPRGPPFMLQLYFLYNHTSIVVRWKLLP